MSNYLVAEAVAGPAFCVLKTVENMPDPSLIRKGVTLSPWPGNVEFHMDPSLPKNIQLPDWVKNLPGALVASKKLQDLIAAAEPVDMEYLPIQIVDHKGRVASDEYFLLNPCSLQDAIDKAQSALVWNPIDPELIADCTELVLDESRIDPAAKVFRLKHYPRKVVFRRELAQAIKAAGCTGIKFIEIADVDS